MAELAGMTLTCFTTTGAGDIVGVPAAGLASAGTITVVVVVPVSRLNWRFGAAVTVAADADTARLMLIAVTAVEVGIIRTVGRPLLMALPLDTAI